MADQREKYSIRKIFDFKEVFAYFFRKKGNQKRPDINLRIMHSVNKISIIIFILALIILIVRNLILH